MTYNSVISTSLKRNVIKPFNLVKIVSFVCILLSSAVATAGTVRQGFDANSLEPNDDESSDRISLDFDVNFFGEMFDSLYINNNGNITFDETLRSFTPFSLTQTTRRIIAPHFSDVDTRGTGTVFYESGIVNGRSAFIVTWDRVGYFNRREDRVNTFQLVLIDRADTGLGDFDIEFNYDQIQWETGDASGGDNGLGGNSARVGFSNGTGVRGTFFELPGSAQNGVFLDNRSRSLVANSNIGVPGRFVFESRNGGMIINENLSFLPAIYFLLLDQ